MPDTSTRHVFTKLLKQKDFEYINEQSQKVSVPRNTTIFRQGDICENYLLVLEGSVKVFSRGENGREVILYRVQSGQSCTLTTACLFADNTYPAEGVCETDATALMIPRNTVNRALAESDAFRKVIFDQYARRLSEVISLIENLSFGHIDIRLARLLLHLSEKNNTIKTTHHLLAAELGSAREVISRQLKAFERQQLITLQRGSIIISNRNELAIIAV